MLYQLFTRVALKDDFPDYGFFRGDVATVVDCHEGMNAEEPGYSLELFNALGETVGVIVVRETQIEPLRKDEIFRVRELNQAAVL
jgi:hypothetical protein